MAYFCLRMREKSQKLFSFRPFRSCIAGSAVFGATETHSLIVPQ